jgi:predicted Zn finger-like uncharacterized protein
MVALRVAELGGGGAGPVTTARPGAPPRRLLAAAAPRLHVPAAMRAVCPSCEATYEVPDRLIGAGRRLRCTNCGHEWTLLPAAAEKPAPAPRVPEAPSPPKPAAAPAPRATEPPPAAATPSAVPPAHPMLRRPPQVIDPPLPPVDDTTGRSRRGDLALRLAWIGSVLLVVLALALLWALREEIAGLWPPAARLVGTPGGGG